MLKSSYCQNILNLLFGFETSAITNNSNEQSSYLSRAREYLQLQRSVFNKQWNAADKEKIVNNISTKTGIDLILDKLNIEKNNEKYTYYINYEPGTRFYPDNFPYETYALLPKNSQDLTPPTYFNPPAAQKQLIHPAFTVKQSERSTGNDTVIGTAQPNQYSNIFSGYGRTSELTENNNVLYGLTPRMAKTADPAFLAQWEAIKQDIINNSFYHTVYECTFIPQKNEYNQQEYIPWYIVLDYTKWETAYRERLNNCSMPSSRYLGYAAAKFDDSVSLGTFLKEQEYDILAQLDEGKLLNEPELSNPNAYARYYLDFDSITGKEVLSSTPKTGPIEAVSDSSLNIYLTNQSTIYFPSITEENAEPDKIYGVGLFTNGTNEEGCYMFMPLNEAVKLTTTKTDPDTGKPIPIMPIIRQNDLIVGFLQEDKKEE